MQLRKIYPLFTTKICQQTDLVDFSAVFFPVSYTVREIAQMCLRDEAEILPGQKKRL